MIMNIPEPTTIDFNKDIGIIDKNLSQQELEILHDILIEPIKEEYRKMNELKNCAICLDIVCINSVDLTPCTHVFHWTCIAEWYKISKTCPVCRKIIILI